MIHLFDRAIQFIIDSTTSDNYRLGEKNINGVTEVFFSSPLTHNNYYVTVLSYQSNTGIRVDYGWEITNKETNKFSFTPPPRYQVGVLEYEVKYYK